MLRVHRELVVAGKCLSKSVKRACADIAENNADCAYVEFHDRLLVMSVWTMRSGGSIVRPIRTGRLGCLVLPSLHLSQLPFLLFLPRSLTFLSPLPPLPPLPS